jgi:antitoxin component of RelBE/YafQ-DinJ toxin-antitoxin module
MATVTIRIDVKTHKAATALAKRNGHTLKEQLARLVATAIRQEAQS